MFDKEFFPTPIEVAERMTFGYDLTNKIGYDPQGGSGNLVDYCYSQDAKEMIASEKHPDLRTILVTKCKVIAEDCFKVKREDIAHVDFIIMNPPFSNADKCIMYAWEIAPAGCVIFSLCNYATIYPDERMFGSRETLQRVIEDYGRGENLEDCFSTADRKTGIDIGLVIITKPGSKTNDEYEGFFMDEESEEQGENGIMSYNFVRDLVNRYVAACKLFDEQLALGAKMSNLTSGFFNSELCFSCTQSGAPKLKEDFKKDMQKAGWNFIFNKMNLDKYSTQGLKEDIKKFVETQTKIPFTMRNIYKMVEIVIATTEQRMDKAILEVFDKITMHYDENRYNVEGWKTNSHYLLNKRFIAPNCIKVGYRGNIEAGSWGNFERIEDLVKALCYVSGDNYGKKISLEQFIRYKYALLDANGDYINDREVTDYDVRMIENDYHKVAAWREDYPGSTVVHHDIEWGKWFDWGYFLGRCYKKGTLHLEFKSEEVWAKFNQRVARLKGYPLFEGVKKTEKPKPSTSQPVVKKATVLATFKV